MESPFLIADASHWTGEDPPWEVLAAHPLMAGVIIKATQGLSYAPTWFTRHWPRVRDVARLRYGDTWFRGCYHYLDCTVDGEAQADYFLDHVERAGGWGNGDIMPIVDVERGGPNGNVDAQQVIAVTEAFARRVRARTGRGVILYGRGIMRDLGITSRMGCDWVWNPSYTREMVTNGLAPAWSVDDVVLWQYAGDGAGDSSAHGLPLTIDGFPKDMDMSVFVDGGRRPNLGSLRRRLLGSLLDNLFVLALLLAAAVALSRGIVALGA